ncbi:hypothetical protein VF13_40730 [Nostoc linckia z16]|nr:hypothetical protein VF13_40730 [Nostoc linckia z16]
MINTIRAYILVVASIFSLSVSAQDYAKVDATVTSYPKSFDNPKNLSDRIKADFKRDDERARAAFTYIALNIKYDLAAYGKVTQPVGFSYTTPQERELKLKKMRDDLAAKTLRSKKGVCEGYATLYKVLCEDMGIQAEIIPGTSKSHPAHIGKAPGASDHAWNAVKIGNEWKLVDATWGAGTVTGEKPAFVFRFNDKYFFADPDMFFLNHYPDDEKWLLAKHSKNEFAQLPLYYGAYHMSGYESVDPLPGTLQAKPSVIPVKIQNLQPGDRVGYAFSRDKSLKMVQPQFVGNVGEFSIPVDSGSAGTLTIYVNDKSVIAYRIMR